MPWWAWFVLGAALLAAEVILATDFYLVFFGVAALLVGALALGGVAVPPWAEWTAFVVFSVASLMLYRKRFRGWLTKPEKVLNREIAGKTAVAVDAIAAGATGSVELRGSRWKARNEGGEAIGAGEDCHVARIEGVMLHVHKLSSS